MSNKKTTKWISGVLLALIAQGCSSDPASGPQSARLYRGYLAHTLRFGQSDNAEVVKIIPGRQQVLVVSSKSRKVSLLSLEGGQLKELRSRSLIPQETGESELTHIDISADGSWAAATRTLVIKDQQGQTQSCQGELLLLDSSDSQRFGEILSRAPLGPMPDSVDISADDQYLVTANERDVIWGKCEGVAGLDLPSISIFDISAGPRAPQEFKRILMEGDDNREPESVVWSKDNDLIAATLQDSHEVALLRRSALRDVNRPTSDQAVITRLPPNSLAADPWPDGITRFDDRSGREWFATAGEADDALNILGPDGTVAATLEIQPSDVPAAFPRDGSWGPLFRPDSITSFVWGDEVYLASTLKASGAVGIWQVSEVSASSLVAVIKVGQDEKSDGTTESSISPEGIAASSELGWIITANEGESSVSLILPE